MTGSAPPGWPPSARQPIFNIPRVVIGLAGVLVAIHALRGAVLDNRQDAWLVYALAFIPARQTQAALAAALPGGGGARWWSFVTYAFLHADWMHLAINGVWLAAFGSPLAVRFGHVRFVVYSAVGAVAGAALHLLFFPGAMVPMVGASAAISAHMAGVSRFAFATGGPLSRERGPDAYRRPAEPLGAVVRDRRVLTFLGLWFGLNLLFGLSGAASGITSGAIAWDAHIGGFLAGLLLFPLFDPVRRGTA